MEFDVKINSGDLYDYMLAHTFHGAAGIIGSGIGAMILIFGLSQSRWMYIVAGVILLAYQPCALFVKSKQQILANPVFAQPLHYSFEEEAICVSQGEEKQQIAWENVVKVTSTNRCIMLYTSPIYASILPRREMGELTTPVIQYISTHVPPKKVKIRF
ncbi:MAG: YcxB family protein [Lachnospiraceae bacterium]|jgi:hypothetical protein|nr:YcxB family protein [Lachnospiraceae bacterium]